MTGRARIVFTSQEEDDQLVGRAIREKAQVDKRLALIAREMDRLAKGLVNLQDEVKVRSFVAGSSHFLVPTEVSEYLDCTKLLALVKEQNELLEQRASLARVIPGSGTD